VVLNEQFEYHYGYGQYAIDVNSDAFKSFVDEIEGRLKEKGRVTIEIVGSASKVPMRANGGNPQLAANRANGLQDLLQAELAKRSTTASGLSFEIRSVVSGPEYQGDYLVNRKTYEKFQYAKAKIK
jgi:hypothetical protein